jgi:hypothetical protein
MIAVGVEKTLVLSLMRRDYEEDYGAGPELKSERAILARANHRGPSGMGVVHAQALIFDEACQD